MNPFDVLAAALLLSGSGFCLLAGVGMQRFDDVFARMHAATKAVTLGILLIAAGAALQVDDPGDRAKLAMVATIQLLTAPVAAHMVGRGAYRSGTELSDATVLDELAEAIEDGAGVEDVAGPKDTGPDPLDRPDADTEG